MKNFFIITALWMVSLAANAGIVSGPHVTVGGKNVNLQGLEWLTLDHTSGISRDIIESVSGWTDNFGNFYAASEWRYATLAETGLLLESIWGGTADGYSNDNYDGASWFSMHFSMPAFDDVGGTNTDALATGEDWAGFYYGETEACVPVAEYSCFGYVSLLENYAEDIEGRFITSTTPYTASVGITYEANSGQAGYFTDIEGLNTNILPFNNILFDNYEGDDTGSLLVRRSTDVNSAPMAAFSGLLLMAASLRLRRQH